MGLCDPNQVCLTNISAIRAPPDPNRLGPLPLLTDDSRYRFKPPTFKFENMRVIQPGFHEVINTAWSKPSVYHRAFSNKLLALKERLLTWRKEAFGNLDVTLKRLKRRIEGIQRSQSYPPSHFLHNLELDLRKEYSCSFESSALGCNG